MSKQDKSSEVGTTGHEWDGIKELNNPLPRWWVWVFYATIAWGVWYTVAYPAWPWFGGATPGYTGYSTRAEVAAEIAAVNERNAGLTEALASADLTTLATNAELHQFAVSAGGAVFRNNCAQCHGTGAAGVQAAGYPNLLDNDWLWGGTIEDIAFTITHGIRNEQSGDARWVEMPAFGDILTPEEISQVVAHVQAISGQEADATLAAAGATLFADNCASCHGEQGQGMREMGAPNLTDAIWLYGGDRETIHASVYGARYGVMPAWAGRLSEDEVRAVAAYVHSLGGGE